jgi:hypothetical protein
MWKKISDWWFWKMRDFRRWKKFRKDFCPRKMRKLLWFLVASLPLATWDEMPPEIQRMTMQYIGYVFCSQIEPDCAGAKITVLTDGEIIVFDVVCLEKKKEI